MLKHFNHEKVRFAMAGTCNTCLDFLLFNFLVFTVALPVLVANTLSVAICVVISYFLNQRYVFRGVSRASWKNLTLFALITGFSSIVLQGLVIWLFGVFTHSIFGHSLLVMQNVNDHRSIQVNMAKAAAVGTGMVWNFLFYKYVVFKRHSTPAANEGNLWESEASTA